MFEFLNMLSMSMKEIGFCAFHYFMILLNMYLPPSPLPLAQHLYHGIRLSDYYSKKLDMWYFNERSFISIYFLKNTTFVRIKQKKY